MIFGILFFALTILFGYSIVRLFKVFRSLEEQFFASIVVGVALSSWAVYLGFYVFGNYAVLATALVEVAATIFLLKRFPAKIPPRSKGFWPRFLPILLMTTALFVQGALQSNANGGYAASLPFLVDLPNHLTIVTNFAYRLNVPPENPFFAGKPFQYPFLADLYSAVLVRAGMPLEIAYNLPLYVLLLSFFALCYFLFLRLHSDKNVAFVAILIIFFASSFALLDFAFDFARNPTSTLFHPQRDYLHIYYGKDFNGDDFEFGYQFFATHMLSQRANSLGYPLAVIIFVLLLEAIDLLKSRNRRDTTNLFLFAGVLAGLLPTLREFAFLAVALVAGGLALFYRDRRWLWFFIPMLLLALPQIVPSALLVVGGGSSMLAWEPGCMGRAACDYQMNVLETASFWLFTFGLPLLLAAVGFLLVLKKARRFMLLLFLVFVLAAVFRFTPDRFNNFKLIDLWLVGMSFLAATAIVRAWEKPRCFWKALAAVALAVSLLPGMFFMQNVGIKPIAVYSMGDIKFAEYLRSHTEENAVFMSYNAPHSLDLAGRTRVLGWYFTVQWLGEARWAERLDDQKAFYSGEERMRGILDKYNVSYVVVTHKERYMLSSFNYYAIEHAPFLKLVYLQTTEKPVNDPKQYWALYQVLRNWG